LVVICHVSVQSIGPRCKGQANQEECFILEDGTDVPFQNIGKQPLTHDE